MMLHPGGDTPESTHINARADSLLQGTGVVRMAYDPPRASVASLNPDSARCPVVAPARTHGSLRAMLAAVWRTRAFPAPPWAHASECEVDGQMNEFALARVLHVLGVVLWIGGVAMVTTVLLPAVR